MRFFTKPFTMTRGVLFLFSFLLLFGRGEASVTCATGHYRTGFHTPNVGGHIMMGRLIKVHRTIIIIAVLGLVQ